MKNKKNTTTFMTVAIGMLVLAMSSIATASDAKTYPGANCDSLYYTNSELYRSSGRIINMDDDFDTHVVCPIIRDNTGSSYTVDITVYVEDLSSSENVECRLDRFSADGSSHDYSSWRKSSGTGDATLTFSNQTVRWSNGYMYVLCKLPNKTNPLFGSSVKNIVVNEK